MSAFPRRAPLALAFATLAAAAPAAACDKNATDPSPLVFSYDAVVTRIVGRVEARSMMLSAQNRLGWTLDRKCLAMPHVYVRVTGDG